MRERVESPAIRMAWHQEYGKALDAGACRDMGRPIDVYVEAHTYRVPCAAALYIECVNGTVSPFLDTDPGEIDDADSYANMMLGACDWATCGTEWEVSE